MTERLAAVVLAAGDSSRLGSPKQLVLYQGLPLVARAARAALKAGADPVVVILGANAEAVDAALSGIPVIPVVNPEWSQGMGTSVATGVKAIMAQAPSVNAVIVLLADQPLVDDAALGRLLDTWTDSDAGPSDGGVHTTIAAAEYAGTVGVPAVFGRAHFTALCSLPPAAGAARLLRHIDARVRLVAMREAAMDVDTAEDLERLFQ
jgi:molybdenum cofactor cytidylyltransferase